MSDIKITLIIEHGDQGKITYEREFEHTEKAEEIVSEIIECFEG